ncbi:MAG TPA: helix-hairpin-helix domain-containing protein [Candidatus Angelobacter sp.]|nr:helix-hairpin-helix domain-containing protein [Candidatus Angelobacter sp.]
MPVSHQQFRAPRLLQDLISVGPAMLRDFELLGIRTVPQLARQDPEKLYKKLCRITGQPVDICCQDVFAAAVAQARNPLLPAEQCQWWFWSRQRKARDARN